MKRSRIWLLLALLLVIGLVTSGCFQIRLFQVKPKSIAAGETVVVRIESYPVSMSTLDTQPGYYFLLVGYDDINWKSASKIDLKGNWGGPYGRGNDSTLTSFLRAGGNCTTNGIDAGDLSGFTNWRTVVSTVEFGPEGPTAAQLDDMNLTKLLFTAPGGVGDDDRGDVVVFSGVWDDDGPFGSIPGVPEAGEVACTSMISFSVPYTD